VGENLGIFHIQPKVFDSFLSKILENGKFAQESVKREMKDAKIRLGRGYDPPLVS